MVLTDRQGRVLLWALAAVAAATYCWDWQHARYHAFYADAVRSMAGSWKAFAYGAFDPGATITIDKLPGYLWPQALSARLLGFHPWTLLLPQAVFGVLCVLVLFRTVRRWTRSPGAALLAAAAFTVTPVVAGLFRTVTEDPLFTLLLLLAADATLRAALTGRLRSLLAAAVWTGLAFQAKMLEAWVVLPVLGGVHLLAAPGAPRLRLRNLAVAGVTAVALSFSYTAAVDLTPVQQRPYVDGTSDDSAWTMVIGYNFASRFGSDLPGSLPPAMGGDDGGLTKLLHKGLASQVDWLYPVAGLSAVLGIRRRRGRPRTDRLRAGHLLWGSWALLFTLVFSVGSVAGHSYYLGVLALPLAALTGAGTAELWRAYRDRTGEAWALPTAVGTTACWGLVLALRYPSFRIWAPVVSGLLALAAVTLLLRRIRPAAGLALGVAAMLLVPAVWTASVFTTRYGHSWLGTVGPSARGGGVSDRLTAGQRRLYRYLTRHQHGAGYLMAVAGWSRATPYILAEGARVLPLGGYTGLVAAPGLAAFRADVAHGTVRYVLFTPLSTPGADPIIRFVRHRCAVQEQTDASGDTLYLCRPSEVTAAF
ncbi:ArnT family glycosyltransferase [Streptacidiphilus monticola]|uniref:ArnT family glycosyltransferase n=1 Tax=Streptacidiphilus monticola TaxID=2161674 RepID=A0ABW1G7F6_9ACTN